MLKRPLHLGLTLLASQNIFNNVTWVSLIYTPILNYSLYENGSVQCDNFQSFHDHNEHGTDGFAKNLY